MVYTKKKEEKYRKTKIFNTSKGRLVQCTWEYRYIPIYRDICQGIVRFILLKQAF